MRDVIILSKFKAIKEAKTEEGRRRKHNRRVLKEYHIKGGKA